MIHQSVARTTDTPFQGRFRTPRGFTIIELMVTVAVLGVIVAVAIPSFRAFIQNSRITSETEAIYVLLTQARSLAQTRGRGAFVCRSDDIDAPSCQTGSGSDDWATGKVLYSAQPGDSATTPNSNFSNQGFQTIMSGATADVRRESIESVVEESVAGVTIVASNDDNVIAFDSQGRLRNSAPFYFAICDDRPNPEGFGRVIEINRIGNARVKKTSDESGEIGCDAS